VGRACSTYGRDEKGIHNLSGNLKGRVHLVELGVNGKIILQWILGKEGGMYGLHASGSG
jgi:hypothetical protein